MISRRWLGVPLVALGMIIAVVWYGRGPESAGRQVEQIGASPVENVAAALDESGNLDIDNPDLPPPEVPLDEIRDGGPPPDGIPPIDDPAFLPVDDVDFLADTEPVISLVMGAEARAYPLQILIWHEIVNDTVDDVPVAVTYCPLCNSAFVWDRRVGTRTLSFGTSGKLWNSSLVMYDRQTRSLWAHFTGDAIAGHLTGSQLDSLPAQIVSWDDFRDSRPDGLVLSRATGERRPYGDNPYPGYDDVDSGPIFDVSGDDDRLAAKERVVGIEEDGEAVAVVLEELRANGVVPVELSGREVLVLWSAGTASALDDSTVAGGSDVGATGVVEASLDGSPLVLSPTDDGDFVSPDGTVWNILGQATAGPRLGERLDTLTHVDTFWFAWSTFQPDSDVRGEPA